MSKKRTKRLYQVNREKYRNLLSYTKQLKRSGKIIRLTRSHLRAIVQRLRRLESYFKKMAVGATFSMMPLMIDGFLQGQCTDISLNPIPLDLSRSGTNTLGIAASPAFSDVDGDGIEDMIVAAWPGIEVYKKDVFGLHKIMFGDQINPFGKIATLKTSAITFYDVIVDDTNREELFVSRGNLGILMYIYDSETNEYKLSTDDQNPFNFLNIQGRTSPIIYSNFNSDILQAIIIDEDGRLNFYFLNNAGFFEELTTLNNLIDEDYQNTYILDLNDDSFYETLVIGKADGSIEYLEFNGWTYEIAATNPFNNIIADEVADPAFNDLDGDGDLDLVIGDLSGRVHTYTNDDGVYNLNDNSKDPLDQIITSDEGVQSIFHDWDGDGNIDVFVGGAAGRIQYIRNDGETYYNGLGKNPFGEIDFGTNASLVFLETDSNYPIAIVGTEDGHIEMLSFNESTGLYDGIVDHSLQSVDVGGRATPSLVDVDLDGDVDLFVGSEEGSISYYRNTGNGSFVEEMGSSNPFNNEFIGRNTSVVFLDVNGDNVKDAFVSGSQGIKYFNYTVSGFVENDAENPFVNLEIGSVKIAKTNLFQNGKYELVLSHRGKRLLTFQSFNASTSSCYKLEDCLVNNWIGNVDEDWNDSPSNWTLHRIPLECDAILVPTDRHLVVSVTNNEKCKGLTIVQGGTMEINGQFEVEIPD